MRTAQTINKFFPLPKRILLLLFAIAFIGYLIFGLKGKGGVRKGWSPQSRYWISLLCFVALLLLLMRLI